MLKYITIHLLSPLCACDNQPLWNVTAELGQISFIIWCGKCNTILTIPIEKVTAYIQPDVQYQKANQDKTSPDKSKLN